jgi:hypothetical protein
MRRRNLAALLRVCTQRDAALGTSETLVWRIAGQVMRLRLLLLVSRAILVIRVCLLQQLRAIAFLNKHGFAALYINRENIVLQMVLGNDKLVSIS